MSACPGGFELSLPPGTFGMETAFSVRESTLNRMNKKMLAAGLSLSTRRRESPSPSSHF